MGLAVNRLIILHEMSAFRNRHKYLGVSFISYYTDSIIYIICIIHNGFCNLSLNVLHIYIFFTDITVFSSMCSEEWPFKKTNFSPFMDGQVIRMEGLSRKSITIIMTY